MDLIKKLAPTAAAVAAGAALLTVPAAALAHHHHHHGANPVKGGTYSNSADGSFAQVSKTGKHAKLTVYSKCNNGIPVQADKPGRIASGILTYDGSATELATQNGTAHLSLTGHFVNRKTLKWTAHVTAGSCKSTVKDTLTLQSSG